MVNVDNIINEQIVNFINESSEKKDIAKLFKKYFSKKSPKKARSQKEKEKEKERKRESKKNKKDIRKRKLVGGGEADYDYDYYKEKNRKVSTADANNIIDTIDQDLTNISAVGQKVFPGHTEEGAQSQLRKVLNGERPLTKPVANKLSKLMANGKIAVK